jgi:hypothetical protein
MKKNIIAGEKYGRWLVLEESKGGHHARCLCVCDCGRFKRVQSQHLKHGLSSGCVSCGVVRHGMAKSGTHTSWRSMHGRCRNTKNASYEKYGGRGIEVCKEWEDFAVFLKDMGERPPGFSIERINSNLGYEPGNCIWADSFTQNNNRSSNRIVSYKGTDYTVAQLARHLGINRMTLFHRVMNGAVLDAPTRRYRTAD